MHFDRAGHELATAPPGWRARTPVLAYGSNACPSKISWLRAHLGLAGPVVVLKVRCAGLAAVWASGLRQRDGQRPATLAALPGVAEDHAVWFATPEQLAVLDVCEGRGHRYDLARLTGADIRLEDGSRLDGVHAYVANSAIRLPLLVDGRPVRVADVGQARAAALSGFPAAGHGVPCEVLEPERTFR
ncbi:gamma-glutamylcyclotransferase [Amycolatopsis sp. PS_44_ISF1]|uniref:gamma-glutamylcyclotransferase n=1 Tax=Amycolatopsis sp. PS_44_ISF1 TaxID=2974917 RepID=UPI0028E04364|nr:gamma-glutamylcyclotransferase [Amycolatopsis sp. PS_44_ISF1]MDT8911211.1 gamma-glutamylcyclotransferase [Amycolatopsis sp. PS_44_ISF1]